MKHVSVTICVILCPPRTCDLFGLFVLRHHQSEHSAIIRSQFPVAWDSDSATRHNLRKHTFFEGLSYHILDCIGKQNFFVTLSDSHWWVFNLIGLWITGGFSSLRPWFADQSGVHNLQSIWPRCGPLSLSALSLFRPSLISRSAEDIKLLKCASAGKDQ